MEPMITPAVINRLKEGDLAAFDEIYLATIQKVYYTVYVLASNKQEVDEMVNEIYFQVWKSISNYDDSKPFLFWLNGLVFRQIKNWKLKAWKRMELIQKLKKVNKEEVNVYDDERMKSTNKQWVSSMIDTLPYKLKAVLFLYYFYEYSLNEIASVLNIPLGTVKSRHHTAIQFLRKKYGHSIDKGEAGIYEC
ncbi:sigma-70 family RNA polymerase sigma factor [Bacillus sp. NEB1478]|uniref:sigma-70 family RNA polymerase sigma factor n=1 Tax=Bacillus sp. NEB1478 TaxID=3073816 RepID=UPI0028739C81|nr:sigma-70 family RNA polymerase sigma factor [Bacillus sp. NEB1478]WNB92516.1 sigma-70 family RNA polymerase sigma factor [Bacillus sp. NEB1478]